MCTLCLVASFLETKERRLLLFQLLAGSTQLDLLLSLSVRVTDGGHGAHTALSRAEQNLLGAFLSLSLCDGRAGTYLVLSDSA